MEHHLHNSQNFQLESASKLGYLLCYNNWIIGANLLLSQSFVVKTAVMFVTVSMNRAEEASTSAVKTCNYKILNTYTQ